MTQTLEGTVHVTTLVAADPDTCFEVFTTQTSAWWRRPARYRFRASGPDGVLVLEPRVGGAVLERLDDGAEQVCGEVLEWSPPRRLRFAWALPRERTEVEVTFVEEGDATRVSVTHGGFGPLEPATKNLIGIRWGDLLLALRRAIAPSP